MDPSLIPDFPRGIFGHIAVAGRPNVGKSTLINQLVGDHLAAVSPQPQTTRKNSKVVYNDDESQLVFFDTPGIHLPKDKLGESMTRRVARPLQEADLILCVADASRAQGQEDALTVDTIAETKKKVILVINKIDIATPEQIEETKRFFQEKLGDTVITTLDICAENNQGLDQIINTAKSNLSVDIYQYETDIVTDMYERDIAEELINEALFESLRDEIPHAATAQIELWKEDEKKIKIHANILIDNERYKKVVIGKNGDMINQIRRLACSKIREGVEQRVDLRLFVKLSPNWRDNTQTLKSLGF